jgi:hypothetical protein
MIERGFINKEEVLSDQQAELIKEAMLKISPSGKKIDQRSDMVLTMENLKRL